VRGRDFLDVEYAIPRLMKFHEDFPVTTLINGMAKGGDAIALAWANEAGIPVEPYPVTKDDWKRLGGAAGPIRNQKMLDQGQPDWVYALPGGNGTAHMAEIARKANIPVTICRYNYFAKDDPVSGFLSNFYEREFRAFAGEGDSTGILYQSNEHYYQCEKTLDHAWREKIISAAKPRDAKRIGNSKTLPFRDDWPTYKLVAMMDGLRLKFPATTNEELTCRLLHTGDEYLVEYAPWGDTFWGVDKEKKGQNWLGRLLMRRRDEILSGHLYE